MRHVEGMLNSRNAVVLIGQSLNGKVRSICNVRVFSSLTYNAHGQPEDVLELQQIPSSEIGPTEVLVEWLAVSFSSRAEQIPCLQCQEGPAHVIANQSACAGGDKSSGHQSNTGHLWDQTFPASCARQ